MISRKKDLFVCILNRRLDHWKFPRNKDVLNLFYSSFERLASEYFLIFFIKNPFADSCHPHN